MMTLEECRAFFAGDRFALMGCGISIDEVWDSGARCSMPLTPALGNANGVAQGGAVYTLCDFTFAVAANAGGTLTVSQSASISYLRPGTGACLHAEAQRLSEGRTACVYLVTVTNDAGQAVATATVNGHRSQGRA